MTAIALIVGALLALLCACLFFAMIAAAWEAFPYLLVIAVCWWMLQALGCL